MPARMAWDALVRGCVRRVSLGSALLAAGRGRGARRRGAGGPGAGRCWPAGWRCGGCRASRVGIGARLARDVLVVVPAGGCCRYLLCGRSGTPSCAARAGERLRAGPWCGLVSSMAALAGLRTPGSRQSARLVAWLFVAPLGWWSPAAGSRCGCYRGRAGWCGQLCASLPALVRGVPVARSAAAVGRAVAVGGRGRRPWCVRAVCRCGSAAALTGSRAPWLRGGRWIVAVGGAWRMLLPWCGAGCCVPSSDPGGRGDRRPRARLADRRVYLARRRPGARSCSRGSSWTPVRWVYRSVCTPSGTPCATPCWRPEAPPRRGAPGCEAARDDPCEAMWPAGRESALEQAGRAAAALDARRRPGGAAKAVHPGGKPGRRPGTPALQAAVPDRPHEGLNDTGQATARRPAARTRGAAHPTALHQARPPPVHQPP